MTYLSCRLCNFVVEDKNSKLMRVTSGCLHSFEEFLEFSQNVKPNSSLDPKDNKKELIPDQLC